MTQSQDIADWIAGAISAERITAWRAEIARASKWTAADLPRLKAAFDDPALLRRRPRKPSIRKLVEQAEKAGKTVTSITTPDGTKLDFGEADRATNFNSWDRVLPNGSKIPS